MASSSAQAPEESLVLEERWPALARSVPELRRRVVAACERAGADADACIDISLAVSEAATNAVLHAFVERPPGTIAVVVRSQPDGVLVSVTDDGAGLVPRGDSPGLGLGLPLIAEVTRQLAIGRGPGDAGTRVEMLFGRRRAGA